MTDPNPNDAPAQGTGSAAGLRSRQRSSRRRRRTVVLASAAAAVLLVATGGVGWAFAAGLLPPGNTDASETTAKRANPGAIPPAIAELSPFATFIGEPVGWSLAPDTEIASVLPIAGDVQDGQVALGIDAPVVESPRTALRSTVQVEGGVAYTLNAWIRVQSGKGIDVPVEIGVGDASFPLPKANANWQEVSFTATVPAEKSSLDFWVNVTGPVRDFAIDQIELIGPDGQNVLENGSFESVTADTGLRNDSLVMARESAALAVSSAPGEISWRLDSLDGTPVSKGSQANGGGVVGIPLNDESQGFYSLTLTGPEGLEVTTPIALVDAAEGRLPVDKRFGVTAQYDRYWHEDAARLAQKLGIGEIRTDFLWKLNETVRGEYSFDERYFNASNRLNVRGLELLATVVYANSLYDGGKTPNSDVAVRAYGDYAAAIASNFRITGLEVFNEFNHGRFNTGACGNDPSCYLPLLHAVHSAVAEAAPGTPIVTGSTAYYDDPWFSRLWDVGGMEFTDVVSYHPYEAALDQPELVRTVIPQADDRMQEKTGRVVPTWITELGWSTDDKGTSGGSIPYERQGEVLLRSAVSALATGAEKFYWYDILNDQQDPTHHEGNFGLYEHEPRPGAVAPAPKVGGFAQALLIAQLDNRAHARTLVADGTYVEVFGEAGDELTVAWAPAGAKYDLKTSVPVRVVDSWGAEQVLTPTNGSVTLSLTADPVFVAVAP